MTDDNASADQYDEHGNRITLADDRWTPHEDPRDDQLEQQLAFNRDVSEELRRLKVRRAAQEQLATESAAPAPPFDFGTLREVLARPAAPPMRAEGLIPSDSSTLLVAQRKTGKTTLVLNYAKDLIEGSDFLGRFPVRPLQGRVVLLNYEVSGPMVARWAADVSVDPDRLLLVNLRSRRNPLAHPDDRSRLAKILRAHQTEAVIVDPFGRAYTGTSQNDSGEVQAWLTGLDAFVRQDVGATDLVLTAHAGWNGERTRGASALEDWADVIITLTRDTKGEDARYLRTLGRADDVEEDRLDFDPITRRLTLAGAGSRKKANDERRLSDLAVYVVRAATEQPGIGVAALARAIKDMDDAPGFRNGEVSRAAKYAAEQGNLSIISGGPGKPTKHFPNTTRPNPSQTPPREHPPTPPTPPIRGRGGGGWGQENHPSQTDQVGAAGAARRVPTR